jgi:hypothetical protein
MQQLGGEVSSLNHIAEHSKEQVYFVGMKLQMANFHRSVPALSGL